MDPVGVMPRRTFTIRTENGVYRRISQEEMQSLVRSRIQQARALAQRRPRESWIAENSPSSSSLAKQQQQQEHEEQEEQEQLQQHDNESNVDNNDNNSNNNTNTATHNQQTSYYERQHQQQEEEKDGDAEEQQEYQFSSRYKISVTSNLPPRDDGVNDGVAVSTPEYGAVPEVCESRYDEVPVVQKRFSWSSVDEDSHSHHPDEEEEQQEARDDTATTEFWSNRKDEDKAFFVSKRDSNSFSDNDGPPNYDIVELLTTDSGEPSRGSSSAGDFENHEGDDNDQNEDDDDDEEQDDIHRLGNHPPHHRLSPTHTTRPLPETPVYNNRVLVDNVVKPRSPSASPKHSSPTLSPRYRTMTVLSSESTNSNSPRAAAAPPSPTRRSISPRNTRTASEAMSPKTARQKRQEQRQARVESLLRMSLSRVRDRARNELDLMLAREEQETPSEVQRTVSMTHKDIDQVVQETVRKAREAAQEEISELLKESVVKARISAEQEILNLVQASVSRVRARVRETSEEEADPDVDPVKATTSKEVGEYAVPDKDLEDFRDVVTETLQKPVAEKSTIANTTPRPAFLETSLLHHHSRGSSEYDVTSTRSNSGTFQSPLLISESLEEALRSGQTHPCNVPLSPWATDTGMKTSGKTAKAAHFFPDTSVPTESEWPYFEHHGRKTTHHPSTHDNSFPVEDISAENTQEVRRILDEATEESKKGMPWYQAIDMIEQKNIRLVDGFPVMDPPKNESRDNDQKSGWPETSAAEKSESFVMWEESPPTPIKDDESQQILGATSALSLGSELAQNAETDDYMQYATVSDPTIDEAELEEHFQKYDRMDTVGSATTNNLLTQSETRTPKLEDLEQISSAEQVDEAQQDTANEPEELEIPFYFSSSSDEPCTPFDEPQEGDLGKSPGEHKPDDVTKSDSSLQDNNPEVNKGGTQDTEVDDNSVMNPSENEETQPSLEETETATQPSTAPLETNIPESLSVELDNIDRHLPSDEMSSNDEALGETFNEARDQLVNKIETSQIKCSEDFVEEARSSPTVDANKEGRRSPLKVSFREETSPIPPFFYDDASSDANEEDEGSNDEDRKAAEEDEEETSEGERGPSYEMEEICDQKATLTTEKEYNATSKDRTAQDESHERTRDNLAPDNPTDNLDEMISAGNEDDLARQAFLPQENADMSPRETHDTDVGVPLTVPENKQAEPNQTAVHTKKDLKIDVETLIPDNNEAQDSKGPGIRQLDSARADSVISPLSLQSNDTSDDDCIEKGVRKFTASIHQTCSEAPISPCRSVPNRQEIVPMFCTNILDAIQADSYETQTIISLRTPSIQTFEGSSSMDDGNSYLTSAVETWMESVADKLEGHPPSPAQRRRRRRRSRQQQQQRSAKTKASPIKDMKREFSSFAEEWLWSLGHQLDVAVDHINDVLGNGVEDDDLSASESEEEDVVLPLLSEIKRTSFSFSDGEQHKREVAAGMMMNAGHADSSSRSLDHRRRSSHSTSKKVESSSSSSSRRRKESGGTTTTATATAMPSSTRRPSRKKTSTSTSTRRIPTREPTRTRSKRERGRSRNKREV